MRKYEKLCEDIIRQVGGKDNIADLRHCITRLRFTLKDESLADDEGLKQTEGVVTILHAAGQYQVVIGNHVPDVFKEACLQLGIQDKITDKSSADEGVKKGVGPLILDYITSIMNPCIAMLCASGVLKGILSILSFAGILTEGQGLYMLWDAASDALFLYFPILLGYTTAKKLKMEPFVGLIIGAAMVYPSIQGVDITILGYTCNATYTSTILPVIFTVIAASFLYHWLMKFIPDVIKTFFVPMLVLAIVVPIGFLFIGPVMNKVGDGLNYVITAGYNLSPTLAGFLVGSLYQIMVIFGVHGVFSSICFLQIAQGEGSYLGFMVGTTFAQTAVVLAIWLKTKDQQLKKVAFPAIISGIFGVTEPAIYGVTLPRIKFFVISCLGAGLTGAFLGLTNTLYWNLTGMGIFTIPGFIGGTENPGIIMANVLISLAIGIAFSFVLTFLLYKDDSKVKTA